MVLSLPRRYVIPSEPWSLWSHNRKLLQLQDQIYNIIHSPLAHEFWGNTGKTHPEALYSVDLEAIGSALNGLPRCQQHYGWDVWSWQVDEMLEGVGI